MNERRKLLICPTGNDEFHVGIEDGLEKINIGVVDGIFLTMENTSRLWTMDFLRYKAEKQVKPILSLNKNHIVREPYRDFCFKIIRDCCRKIIEERGEITIKKLMTELQEINGGKKNSDISTYQLRNIIRNHFAYEYRNGKGRYSIKTKEVEND